jgi:hypothetical protein
MDSRFFRKYIDLLNEAIIDTPINRLSDIFAENGKMYPEVKKIITGAISKLQSAFPDLKIIDYFIVGAAVTYQYKSSSDIDTSIVVDKNTPKELFDKVYDYCREVLEDGSIPAWNNQRPFQFTPQYHGRNEIVNVDAAYDPKTDTWIKKPDYSNVQTQHQNLISNPQSKENSLYNMVERSIQPNLIRLYNELIKSKSITQAAKDYIGKALHSYKLLKQLRYKGYKKDPKNTDRTSQNWSYENIIYKMLDAEKYGKFFELINKEFINGSGVNDTALVQQLINTLQPVIHDEIGFKMEGRNMDPRFFRKYIDILNEGTESVDINSIASQLKFLPTKKQAKQYKFVKDGSPGQMPPMTYTVATKEQPVVTITSDGKETQNVAAPNDIIMSGPSKENYVIKSTKFPKLYQGEIGGVVVPEQGPRMVALYTGQQPVTFTAPWGESMVLKPGDYLVKDGDAGYYRIAKVEYEQTYNPPGK